MSKVEKNCEKVCLHICACLKAQPIKQPHPPPLSPFRPQPPPLPPAAGTSASFYCEMHKACIAMYGYKGHFRDLSTAQMYLFLKDPL